MDLESALLAYLVSAYNYRELEMLLRSHLGRESDVLLDAGRRDPRQLTGTELFDALLREAELGEGFWALVLRERPAQRTRIQAHRARLSSLEPEQQHVENRALLLSLFHVRELRVLAYEDAEIGRALREVEQAAPFRPVVRRLLARGAVNDDLFRALERDRPGRADEVKALWQRWAAGQ